jgi:hypothetical protein
MPGRRFGIPPTARIAWPTTHPTAHATRTVAGSANVLTMRARAAATTSAYPDRRIRADHHGESTTTALTMAAMPISDGNPRPTPNHTTAGRATWKLPSALTAPMAAIDAPESAAPSSTPPTRSKRPVANNAISPTNALRPTPIWATVTEVSTTHSGADRRSGPALARNCEWSPPVAVTSDHDAASASTATPSRTGVIGDRARRGTDAVGGRTRTDMSASSAGPRLPRNYQLPGIRSPCS